MRAYFGACGLNINLTSKDKDKKRLEFIVGDYKKPKVLLLIKNKVENKGIMEEPGFHIQAWPPNVSLDKATKIYVYLSEERWNDLLTKRDEGEIGGGFFTSRYGHNRFAINYYPDI